jgi:hypothetical protein
MRHLRVALAVALAILNARPAARGFEGDRWPVPAASLVMANAYGDTAWFESRTITSGYLAYITPHGEVRDGPLHFVPAWARSPGTPLLVVTPWHEPLEPARDVVGRVCAKAIRVRSVFPNPEGKPTVYEPGYFGGPAHPGTFGWDLHCSASDSSRVRVVFFVIGRADHSVGEPPPHGPRQEGSAWRPGAGGSAPIQVDRFRRYFEIDSGDCSATFRIVGDVQVDLANARIAPSDSAAAQK